MRTRPRRAPDGYASALSTISVLLVLVMAGVLFAVTFAGQRAANMSASLFRAQVLAHELTVVDIQGTPRTKIPTGVWLTPAFDGQEPQMTLSPCADDTAHRGCGMLLSQIRSGSKVTLQWQVVAGCDDSESCSATQTSVTVSYPDGRPVKLADVHVR